VNYEGIGNRFGEQNVKLVVFEDGNFVNSMIYDTATFYRDFCSNVNQKINVDFEKLDIGYFDSVYHCYDPLQR